MDLDVNDPELNKAAVKIQSSYRGFHTRKEMHKPNKDETDTGATTAAASADKAKMSSEEPQQEGSKTPATKATGEGAADTGEELLDFANITDEDELNKLNNAATAIQSGFKGYQTRKSLKVSLGLPYQ